MYRFWISIVFSALGSLAALSQINFTGTTQKVIEITPENSTGLNRIYVYDETSPIGVVYTSTTAGSRPTWYRFSSSGGGFADIVQDIQYNGQSSSLQNPGSDCGYIIEDGSDRFYFWIINYSDYYFNISNVSFPDEQDCGTATLDIVADCRPITYYSITGVPMQLSREIQVSYSTLEWDNEQQVYNSIETGTTEETLGTRLVVPAPYCNTVFVLSGDRFLNEWGKGIVFETDLYETKSIDVRTVAEQSLREVDNEQQEETTNSLGGSAPVSIEFNAYCTDAVTHKEWQVSRDPEFDSIDFRFNEESISQTFTEDGTTYVRFVGSNEDASCVVTGESYEVTIGESALDCPNAFSPNASEGINDEWKVSYKSIVSFSCHIFDRYGNKMCSFTDPSMGWDGKYKGKFVRPGVYYYVIQAEGADGKVYNMKGDINILKSSNNNEQ